jgi:ribose transport system ATP-binding protein
MIAATGPLEPTDTDDRIPAIAARGIRKSFNGIEVLHGVDFTLLPGEIHGLVGQNGAGKSTLIKIIDGAYAADEGTVEVRGEPLDVRGRSRVRKRGIATVFQEFSLIPTMSVAQNIFLGREPRRWGPIIDDGALLRAARAALASVGAQIDPTRNVEDLPVGDRQLVEIAKALSQEATVLILDEPTASLSGAEVANLIRAVRMLVARGLSVIYISHHLEEVVAFCDRVTVLRDGSVTMTAATSELTVGRIIDMMLGRSLENLLEWRPRTAVWEGPPRLRLRGLRNARLNDVSLDIRRGEIVGVAGLLGSGRSEIVRAIFGIDRLHAGTIEVDGQGVRIVTPRDAMDAGVALVPEDRARAGLVGDHSVASNILMSAWARFARLGVIDDHAATSVARGFVERLHVRTASIDLSVRRLSGGNQQKVVVARNLTMEPRVLLLDDPTVGIDIASKTEILMEVRGLADQGHAVLLISSELEELAGLADRVLVIRDGAIVRTLDRASGDDLSEDAISRAVQGDATGS